MAEIVMLDRAYYRVMQRPIHTGQAPHHTELATELGLEMEAGKQRFQTVPPLCGPFVVQEQINEIVDNAGDLELIHPCELVYVTSSPCG